MYAQCDIDGTQHLLIIDVVDCKKESDDASISDKIFEHKSRKHMMKNTRGWHLCVQWRDGTFTCEWLSVLKKSNPVDVAKFAVSQGIDEEPGFAWWVHFTLKKRYRFLSTVNSRYHKCTHIFGIEIPKYAKDAKIICDTNGNNYWQDDIAKEIKTVRIAFKILHGSENIPPTHQHISCCLIFDGNIDDFRRKAS